MKDLTEKVVLVTGGSRGVGRATAIRLGELGCSVVITYFHDKTVAEETAHEIYTHGVKVVCEQGDVAEDATCIEWVRKAVETFGRLDLLINNAATTAFIPHENLGAVGDDIWDRIFRVNVRGPFQCIRAAVPFMRKEGSGHIINIASIAGLSMSGSSIPYGASKAALINMTTNLARVLGPAIRVNCVAPGFIEGDWLRQGLGEQYQAAKQYNETRAPLNSVCRPEDVADAIVSLVTGSRMITGQTLVVDGGLSIT